MVPLASGGATRDFDLVTMKNGDIFNGSIEAEHFDLITDFGRISIPGHAVGKIRFGDSTSPDLLRTRSGDLYRGQLKPTDLVMERVLDPPLPLVTRDIAVIYFASGQTISVGPPAPDLVETQSGEYFHARTLTRELMIRSSSSIELIELSGVRHLDVLYSEEKQIVRAQFTLRDGSRLRGNLLTRRIQLQEPFGSMLSMPMKALERISFKVDTPGGLRTPYLQAHSRQAIGDSETICAMVPRVRR